MSLVLIVKLVHVLIAVWFISGLLGRWVALNRAAEAGDVRIAFELSELAGRFERLMVIPGSILVLVFGLVTAWIAGLPVFGFLQGASTNWLLASLILYISTIPLVPLLFLPRGARFGAALSAALERGEVTSELRAAFVDPAVRAGHIYEFVVVFVVLALMVLKPF